MLEIKIGEYVEVGFGESVNDNEGYSYFFKMDKEGYTETDIEYFFGDKDNVLYVQVVSDEGAIHFAGDKKFSDFLED